MARDFEVVGTPERLERLHRWYAASRSADPADRPRPAPVRPASTVMIVRDGAYEVEVVMLERSATMAFAASFHAFPGGALEPEDGEGEAGHVAAAVREAHEECGIVLDPAALRPRSRWVGPEFEPRRFDTWVYAAACPPGAQVESRTTESVTMEWVRPSEVLAAHRTGEVLLMPPTLVSLEEVAASGSVEELLARPPLPGLYSPQLAVVGERFVMRTEGLPAHGTAAGERA